MNTNSQQIMSDTQNALQAAQTAFQTLATALTNALAQVKDMAEELIQVHAVNQRLEQENKAQSERIGELENSNWEANRAKRNAEYERDNLSREVETLKAQLAESKAEAVKLREVILNVATVTDPIINPRTPAPQGERETYMAPQTHAIGGTSGAIPDHYVASTPLPETPVNI